MENTLRALQKRKLSTEVLSIENPLTGAINEDAPAGFKLIRLCCFFCDEPATVRVDKDPFCLRHGAQVLADNLDWLLSQAT